MLIRQQKCKSWGNKAMHTRHVWAQFLDCSDTTQNRRASQIEEKQGKIVFLRVYYGLYITVFCQVTEHTTAKHIFGGTSWQVPTFFSQEHSHSQSSEPCPQDIEQTGGVKLPGLISLDHTLTFFFF